MKIKDFNINQALNGASIGFINDKGKVAQYIIDFRYSNEKRADKEFVGIGQDDNIEYFFNRKGECYGKIGYDKDKYQLWRFEETINYTSGTTASRGEVDEEGNEITVPIESMQPREQFAMAAMKSIIGKIEGNILGIDDYKITKIGELSFKLAQVMMTLSAKFRELAKEEEVESPYIEIDKEALTDDTNKILYNIQTVLKG